MSRSRFVLALLLLALTVALWFTQRPSATPPSRSPVLPEHAAATPVSEVPLAPAAPTVAPATPAAPLPKTRSGLPQPPAPPAADEAIERDLTHVQLMFREFRDVLGGNPVGNNAEIMRAILGGNLKQAKFAVPEGQTTNAEGELVDRWGTPYFFHQVSKDKMEVRSAGPDRQMWTADDRQM